MTLDQLTWSDTVEGAPVIVFIGQGHWTDGSTLYYHNFRLIDTGATGGPVASDIKITSVQYDARANSIALKWDSAAGRTYAIDFTPDLGSWPTVLAPAVQGTQGTTTYTGALPTGTRGFLRIRPTN